MAVSTYAELQTAIANWLDRTDISSDRVKEFIVLAEARIGRRLRSRGVEGRDTSITTVAGTEFYTLPTDFLEARSVTINTNPIRVMRYLTPVEMDRRYSSTSSGVSTSYTIIGNEIQLKPAPDSAETLELSYYKKLAALSDSNTTNWLTSNAPDLLLYGSLIEAESYLVNDPRIALWKAIFDEAIAEWNLQDDRGRRGTPLQIMGTV